PALHALFAGRRGCGAGTEPGRRHTSECRRHAYRGGERVPVPAAPAAGFVNDRIHIPCPFSIDALPDMTPQGIFVIFGASPAPCAPPPTVPFMRSAVHDS